MQWVGGSCVIDNLKETRNWYAFHIYRNTRKVFISKLESDAQQYYVAEQVVYTCRDDYSVETSRKLLFPSIVFVYCTEEYVESVRRDPYSQVAPYTIPGTKTAAIISDKEMQIFMFVLSTGYEHIDVVDNTFAKGDRVRVLEGVFKGAEGYIVRIKGDRRFVVSLHGVAAVATAYIPQRFLQKIPE